MPVGKFVLDDVKIYVGGYDLSADHNELDLSYEAEVKDKTTFGASGREKLAGLVNAKGELTALYEAGVGKVDTILHGKLASADEVLTFSPDGGADGEDAFTMRGVLAEYAPQGSIGEMFVLKTTLEGSGRLIKGTIMAAGAKTATGNGTARQLGAVTATQKMYASLHVIAASGTNPTLDVIIESDDAVGMATPTTRITFAQKTAVGAEFATPIGGAIADDWIRASWTIGGTDPSFTVVIVVGIK